MPSFKTEFCNPEPNDAITLLLFEMLNKAERFDDNEMEGTSRKLRTIGNVLPSY